MVTVPNLNRLSRLDTPKGIDPADWQRQMNLWDELCTEIEGAFGGVNEALDYVAMGMNPDGTIKDDKVATAAVQAGAMLATPGGNVTSSTTLTSGSYTWTDCGSVTPTMSGAEATITVDFDTEVVDNCKLMYRLRYNSTTLGRERGPISVNTADEPGYSITRRHTPSAGSQTYTLQCAVNDANDIIVHDPVFSILENNNL
jgi:hypothetical protein